MLEYILDIWSGNGTIATMNCFIQVASRTEFQNQTSIKMIIQFRNMRMITKNFVELDFLLCLIIQGIENRFSCWFTDIGFLLQIMTIRFIFVVPVISHFRRTWGWSWCSFKKLMVLFVINWIDKLNSNQTVIVTRIFGDWH